MDAGAKAVFTDGGKLYAIPTKNYSMGLVYNKKLFTQAGLDPKNPPTTWRASGTRPRRSPRSGGGIAATSSTAPVTPGLALHRVALLAGRPDPSSAAGKKADFNNAMGKKVLQNLRDMRLPLPTAWGETQLLGWADLLTNAGAGKVGMFIGAPDTTTAIVTQFEGKYEDWAMGPLPGQGAA